MVHVVAYLSALVFGLGLGLSGMTDPRNVIGFLDIFGAWQPALALVMVGAIAVHSLSYYLIMKRPTPLLTPAFYMPTKQQVDMRLIIGAVVFGIGWGMGGFCPGPALASIVTLHPDIFVFIISMILGIGFYHYAFKPRILERHRQ